VRFSQVGDYVLLFSRAGVSLGGADHPFSSIVADVSPPPRSIWRVVRDMYFSMYCIVLAGLQPRSAVSRGRIAVHAAKCD
jgi:hypothetical protein